MSARITIVLFSLFLIQSLSACASRSLDSAAITVLISTYNAGAVTTEAFRITPSGKMGGGSWTNQNRLISQYHPSEYGKTSYQQFLSAIASIEPQNKALENVLVLGPPAVKTVEIILPESFQQRFIVMDHLPDAIDSLVARMRALAKPKPVEAGCYIWAISAHPDSDPIDLPSTEKVPKASIERALDSVDIIVPAGDSFEIFKTQKNKFRSRFVAEAKSGRAYFGVVRAP